ncbi:MAG TPA: hypothetical protein VIO57_08840 [Chloroflexota bacterium]
MIQRGERIASGSAATRAGTTFGLRLAGIRTDIAVGSPDLARVGIITVALILQSLVMASPGHFRPATTWYFAVFVTLGTLVSLGLCAVQAFPIRSWLPLTIRRGLCCVALIGLTVLAGIGVTNAVSGVQAMAVGAPYSNDGAVMDYYAAVQVSHGRNPYFKTNIVAALASMNARSTTVTPLMDGQFRGSSAYPSDDAVQQVFLNVLKYRSRPGVPVPNEFESKYNYPAGSFLFIMPFVWMGLHDMRFLYALAVLGMGVYLWKRMPRSLRWLAPLIVLADVPLLILSRGGQPDPLYGLFLMLGFAEWGRSRTSPILMGLAAATKQLAWFFLPFYVILIVRRFGPREALRRTGIIAAVYLLLNGFFIVKSPGAYLSSIMGPMSDPMFPMGIGVISLFVSGVLPMAPKIAFSIAEVTAWAGSMYAFWRSRLLLPASVAALAALPLFFAWRSLVNYFYLVPILALAFTLAAPHQESAQVADTRT